MSLVVSVQTLRGYGAVGDRVARVIFRGKDLVNEHSDLPILFSGVSKVSRVFEQHDQVSVIGEVGKSFVFCMHFRKA